MSSYIQDLLGNRRDASCIRRGLWMGSRPAPENVRDFDAIVFCAEEFQPAASKYPWAKIIRARLYDEDLSSDEARAAIKAAMDAADAIDAGGKVLVTCNAGSNRSGLVVALTMGILDPNLSPDRAIKIIREKRKLPKETKREFDYPYAMVNSDYNEWLRTKGPKVRDYMLEHDGKFPPWL